MLKRTFKTDAGFTTEFSADIPVFVVPRELYRFEEDGVAYVYTACGRTFIAKVWDEKLNPPKTPVLPKRKKMRLPRKPLELFDEEMLYQ